MLRSERAPRLPPGVCRACGCCCEWGVEAGNGEPMILVHGSHFGGPSRAHDREHNIGPLSETFDVYALDKYAVDKIG